MHDFEVRWSSKSVDDLQHLWRYSERAKRQEKTAQRCNCASYVRFLIPATCQHYALWI